MMKKNILTRLQTEGNPLIDGKRATFYWMGDSAPHLIDDLHDWDDQPQALAPVPGSDKPLWSTSLTLPGDAYVEYIFFDPQTKQRYMDPFNPRRVSNGFGNYNHYFYMSNGEPTPLAQTRIEVKHGALTRHIAETLFLVDNGLREVHFYHPPVKRPVPLLVVYDGTDYLRRASLATLVDNLIAEKRIRPIAMAFLQNGKSHRSVEYACSDAVITWLDQVILPMAREHLNLLDLKRNLGAYGVLGASFGGLISMYTGLRMPEIFGRVLSQAAIFEYEGRDFAAVDLIRAGQGSQRLKIWMDVGRFDSLLKDNRRLQPLLRKHGYDVTYREFSGGHNYTAWRDDLWRGLEALFPAERKSKP
ncbi:MAG: esterase family protein [Chloroflexi bacterium]|nr:esterase family protein [Chloroflexota bacterium]